MEKKILYLYIDESVFLHDDKEFYSVGMLALEQEPNPELIEEALIHLKNDPDINKEKTKKMDANTLSRGFFHATDDSMNAHSHFCKAILENNVNGIVYYSVLKPNIESELSAEKKHRINTELVSLITTGFDGEIKIFIEQRTEFTQSVAQKFYESFYETIDQGAYLQPFLSTLYPKIEVNVVEKSNPGIQIIDFITWAMNNQYSRNKKGEWVGRLLLKFSMRYDVPTGYMAGSEYYLGKGIVIQQILRLDSYPHQALSLNDDFYRTIDLQTTYMIAEQILNEIHKNRLPDQASHFQEELDELNNHLQKDIVSTDTIKRAAKLFIRLFDTLPMYSSFSKDQDHKFYKVLLHVKRSMGLMNGGKINGLPAAEFFKQIREAIILTNKSILQQKPDLAKLTALF